MNDRVPSGTALVIALTLQFAATAEIGGNRKTAVWIAALGVALFVWQWTHKRSKVLLVIVNAILLTLPMPRYFGSGQGDDASATPSNPAQPKNNTANRRDGGAAIVADQTFPGVILFPEVQDHATLVPPLPALSRAVFSAGQRNPLDIPFFGSYYLYKYPQNALPKTAITMHGDPDRKTFRSTDLTPMRMEAHQNLGAFFELACCRAVEIAVRNADRYPGSVEVELELRNTAEKQRLVLGRMPVASTPRWGPGARQIVSEVLEYAMPEAPPMKQFDEFAVRFVLGRVRSDHSAGIAIQRFTLLPRAAR